MNRQSMVVGVVFILCSTLLIALLIVWGGKTTASNDEIKKACITSGKTWLDGAGCVSIK